MQSPLLRRSLKVPIVSLVTLPEGSITHMILGCSCTSASSLRSAQNLRPCSARPDAAEAVLLKPETENPESNSLPAIPIPILPNPAIPICLFITSVYYHEELYANISGFPVTVQKRRDKSLK